MIIKLAFLFCLLMLIFQSILPFAFGAGTVKYYQINSKLLADGGERAQRELGVYLPEGYDTSGATYPALYLIHGFTGNDRTFLGAGYGGAMSNANVSLIVDKLTQNGKITPLIVVCPDVNRTWTDKGNGIIAPYDDYLIKDIVEFIDTTFRTIPLREMRAIAGHSMGGHDAYHTAFFHPEMFSLVGGYSSDCLDPESVAESHDQKKYPLQFWIYAGRNDDYGLDDPVRNFVSILKNAGLPCVYVEDDGNHINMIAQRLEESIIFFSRFLSGSEVNIKTSEKIANTWGNIKQKTLRG